MGGGVQLKNFEINKFECVNRFFLSELHEVTKDIFIFYVVNIPNFLLSFARNRPDWIVQYVKFLSLIKTLSIITID